ncbi:hypothetical protein DFH07DRAFT_937697 [Mycena maculata]|uniref:Uncharacterized protein n=1 Tax=Mycena maculata TaxID=230809 RepID=A0AAD7JUB5_9AGAR|nr:hypothetical protein DFH07DRAFT_937697 [Mycena maculata]
MSRREKPFGPSLPVGIPRELMVLSLKAGGDTENIWVYNENGVLWTEGLLADETTSATLSSLTEKKCICKIGLKLHWGHDAICRASRCAADGGQIGKPPDKCPLSAGPADLGQISNLPAICS